MNELQMKLVAAGLARAPKTKRGRTRKIKCRKCGEAMERTPESNVVVCPECGNYIIFEAKEK